MTEADDNINWLREWGRGLSWRLQQLRERELRERNMTPAEIRELRWLEKDYDPEEKDRYQ